MKHLKTTHGMGHGNANLLARAVVQPSTATRLDAGINLKDRPAMGRLEASGSFNAMVSHRGRVMSVAEIDSELIGWLREAFGLAS